jgi:hypothetical protein
VGCCFEVFFVPIDPGVQFWGTPVRAVCFTTKKIRPANWYGSKESMWRGGVALNALGFLTLLARLPVKSLDEMKRTFKTQLSEEFASHACAEHPRVKGATPWKRRAG